MAFGRFAFLFDSYPSSEPAAEDLLLVQAGLLGSPQAVVLCPITLHASGSPSIVD